MLSTRFSVRILSLSTLFLSTCCQVERGSKVLSSAQNEQESIQEPTPPSSRPKEILSSLQPLRLRYREFEAGIGRWTAKMSLRKFKDWEKISVATSAGVLDVLLVSKVRVRGELLVHSFPLLINSIQGAVLLFAGDMIAQTIADRRQGVREAQLDWPRLGKAGLAGILMLGVWPYYWYRLLDWALPQTAPETTLAPVWLVEWVMLAAKIVLDSTVNGALTLGMSFTLWSLMDDDSVHAWCLKFHKRFLETWVADWATWPAFNVVCFALVPTSLRPLASAMASMLWNAFVSHQSQSLELREEEVATPPA